MVLAMADERKGESKEPAMVYKPRSKIKSKTGNFDRVSGNPNPPPASTVVIAPPPVANDRKRRSYFYIFIYKILPSLLWLWILHKQMDGINGMFATKQFNIPQNSTKTFDDVKGCDEAKSELQEIVQHLRNPDMFTRLGGTLPRGILLTGPPGTGKTLLVKAIAGETQVPFFYRAGSEFEEMFVGLGARRVRSLFKAAKKHSPSIIFIDEIDAVGGNRKNSLNDQKETLNQLLVEMDGFDSREGVIVFASTNLPETLDPALTRPGRFDRRVVLPNPDVRGRQEILDLYLKDKPVCDEVDTKTVARGTPGFTGADLANLVNMAAIKATVDGSNNVCSTDLDFAKDKILMGAERNKLTLSEESRRLTAYHEGGHVVAAFHTAGANPIHKATILPRGAALGMVIQLPERDETSLSKMQLLAHLDVAMGGRVAEEIIFGSDQVTTGARDDLKQATNLARTMVSELGMSDSLGPIFVDQESQRQLSQETQKNIDAEIVRFLKEAYERVGTLLNEHEASLHSVAQALLEHETLSSKQIRDILERDASVVEVSRDLSHSTVLAY